MTYTWPAAAINIATPGVYLITLDVLLDAEYSNWNPTMSLRAGFNGTVNGKIGDSWLAPLVPESAIATSFDIDYSSTTFPVPGFAVGGRGTARVTITRPYSFAAADLLIPFANVIGDTNLSPIVTINQFGAIYLPTSSVPPANTPRVAEAQLQIVTSGSTPVNTNDEQFACTIWTALSSTSPWTDLTQLSCFVTEKVSVGARYEPNFSALPPPNPTGTVSFYYYNIVATSSSPAPFPDPGSWSLITTVDLDEYGEAAWTGAATFLTSQESGDTVGYTTTTWITAFYSGDTTYAPSYAVQMGFVKPS